MAALGPKSRSEFGIVDVTDKLCRNLRMTAADHEQIIKLIIAYTLVGAFVFTVAVTCVSLVRKETFANKKQQQMLFKCLIIELVIACVGYFAGFLRWDYRNVAQELVEHGRAAVVTLPGNAAVPEFNMALFLNPHANCDHFRTKIVGLKVSVRGEEITVDLPLNTPTVLPVRGNSWFVFTPDNAIFGEAPKEHGGGPVIVSVTVKIDETVMHYPPR